MSSVVYKSSFLYEVVMRGLYGRNYNARYQVIANLIPQGSSVLDVCCGPAVLFRRFLRRKRVRYTGIDINEIFIAELERAGGNGLVADVRAGAVFPEADYVTMQASLYHFLPEPGTVVNRMLAAARREVIISEPVRNVSTSRIPLLSWLARAQTNPGKGEHRRRFNETELDAFFSSYRGSVKESFLAPGGREKIFVLRGRASEASS